MRYGTRAPPASGQREESGAHRRRAHRLRARHARAGHPGNSTVHPRLSQCPHSRRDDCRAAWSATALPSMAAATRGDRPRVESGRHNVVLSDMSDDWRSLSPVSGGPWAFTTAPWIPGVVTRRRADDSLRYQPRRPTFEAGGTFKAFVFRGRHARHYPGALSLGRVPRRSPLPPYPRSTGLRSCSARNRRASPATSGTVGSFAALRFVA